MSESIKEQFERRLGKPLEQVTYADIQQLMAEDLGKLDKANADLAWAEAALPIAEERDR